MGPCLANIKLAVAVQCRDPAGLGELSRSEAARCALERIGDRLAVERDIARVPDHQRVIDLVANAVDRVVRRRHRIAAQKLNPAHNRRDRLHRREVRHQLPVANVTDLNQCAWSGVARNRNGFKVASGLLPIR